MARTNVHLALKGEIAKCTATIRACPRGGLEGVEDHYRLQQEDVGNFSELIHEEEFGGAFGGGMAPAKAEELGRLKEDGAEAYKKWKKELSPPAGDRADHEKEKLEEEQIKQRESQAAVAQASAPKVVDKTASSVKPPRPAEAEALSGLDKTIKEYLGDKGSTVFNQERISGYYENARKQSTISSIGKLIDELKDQGALTRSAAQELKKTYSRSIANYLPASATKNKAGKEKYDADLKRMADSIDRALRNSARDNRRAENKKKALNTAFARKEKTSPAYAKSAIVQDAKNYQKSMDSFVEDYGKMHEIRPSGLFQSSGLQSYGSPRITSNGDAIAFNGWKDPNCFSFSMNGKTFAVNRERGAWGEPKEINSSRGFEVVSLDRIKAMR